MAELLLKKDTISRPKIRVEKTGSLFFYLVLIVFLMTLASYGGIIFLNKTQRDTQAALLEQVNAKEKELKPELTNQIFLLEKRLKNMRSLLDQHTFVSSVIRRLEEDALPQVRLFGMNFTSNLQKVDTTGVSTSYGMVARQIETLERDPQVDTVEFGGLSATNEGLVNFRLGITFKPTLLRQKP